MRWKVEHLKPIDWDVDENDDPFTVYLPIGYDGQIVDDAFFVLEYLSAPQKTAAGHDETWYTVIAGLLFKKEVPRDGQSVEARYVHLILEVFAGVDLIEYGSSPRGSWLTDAGKELLRMARRWRAGEALEYVPRLCEAAATAISWPPAIPAEMRPKFEGAVCDKEPGHGHRHHANIDGREYWWDDIDHVAKGVQP